MHKDWSYDILVFLPQDSSLVEMKHPHNGYIYIYGGGVLDLLPIKKVQSIMDKCQEREQLLEPGLESIVSLLMHIVCTKSIESGIKSEEIFGGHQATNIIIYTLVTVCDYKTLLMFSPH